MAKPVIAFCNDWANILKMYDAAIERGLQVSNMTEGNGWWCFHIHTDEKLPPEFAEYLKRDVNWLQLEIRVG